MRVLWTGMDRGEWFLGGSDPVFPADHGQFPSPAFLSKLVMDGHLLVSVLLVHVTPGWGCISRSKHTHVEHWATTEAHWLDVLTPLQPEFLKELASPIAKAGWSVLTWLVSHPETWWYLWLLRVQTGKFFVKVFVFQLKTLHPALHTGVAPLRSSSPRCLQGRTVWSRKCCQNIPHWPKSPSNPMVTALRVPCWGGRAANRASITDAGWMTNASLF